MTDATDRSGRGATARAKGRELVEGLRELVAALEAGEPLGARFTVRTYRISAPPGYDGAGVRRVRGLLGMSQAAFAAFLGVDPSTVRSWEQGVRTPSPVACRLLSEIEADPAHWRRRLAACVVGPETRGPAARDVAGSRVGRRARAEGRTG